MSKISNGLVLGFAFLSALSGCAPPEPVDLVLHNGKIVTVDDAFSIQQAVAVRDGRIVEVGDNDLLSKYDASQTIDLEGKTVLPGFNDVHIHISGDPIREIDLRETTSVVELQGQVRAKVQQLGEGVLGRSCRHFYGWSEDRLRRARRSQTDTVLPVHTWTSVEAGPAATWTKPPRAIPSH